MGRGQWKDTSTLVEGEWRRSILLERKWWKWRWKHATNLGLYLHVVVWPAQLSRCAGKHNSQHTDTSVGLSSAQHWCCQAQCLACLNINALCCWFPGAPADSGTLDASLALCCTKANELFGDSINTSASDSRDFMDFVGSSIWFTVYLGWKRFSRFPSPIINLLNPITKSCPLVPCSYIS